MKQLRGGTTWWGTAVVIAVFFAVRIAYWATGGGFTTVALVRSWSWQILDSNQLTAHPFQSVALLHTQPPLFNLFVGVVMRWSPLTTAVTLQLAYLACGLVMIVALRLLLLELGFMSVAATIAACVVAINPILLAYENVVTYEIPVAALLVVSALLCARYATSRRLTTFTWFVLILTAIVLTRSLFHPIWLIACVLFVALIVRAPVPPRRYLAAIAAIPIVLIGGWIIKNEALFGQPTLSSWFGMNISRGIIAPMPHHEIDALIDSGDVSKAARVRTFSSYTAYERFFGPCRSSFSEPVLRSPTKTNGQSNFNAECYLRVYDDAQHNALEALVARPGTYLSTRGPSVAQHFSLPNVNALAPDSGSGKNSLVKLLSEPYQRALLTTPVTIDDRDWAVPLFGGGTYTIQVSIVLAFATLLLAIRGVSGAVGLARGRRTAANITWVYLGFTTVFIFAISVATEYGENGRFRLLLDPMAIGVLVAQLVTAVEWIWRRITDRQPEDGRAASASLG